MLYANGEVQIHQENASLKKARVMISTTKEVEFKGKKTLNGTKRIINIDKGLNS